MEIKSTSAIAPTNLHCLIYGVSGVGKTTLAKTLNGKTLIISAESGLLSLMNTEIDYVEVNTLDELRASLKLIDQYDNIFIDSLTEICAYFLDEALEQFPEENQLFKRYGRLLETMTKFIKYTRDLPKNIIYTALQKTDKDQAGRRFNIPDMSGSIASKCPAFFDFVFNMQPFEKDGEELRLLLTASKEGFVAKDRSGKLSIYEAANLGDIINKIF